MKGIISDFPFAIYVKELCAVNGIGKGPNLPLATGSVKVISKTLQVTLALHVRKEIFLFLQM